MAERWFDQEELDRETAQLLYHGVPVVADQIPVIERLCPLYYYPAWFQCWKSHFTFYCHNFWECCDRIIYQFRLSPKVILQVAKIDAGIHQSNVLKGEMIKYLGLYVTCDGRKDALV